MLQILYKSILSETTLFRRLCDYITKFDQVLIISNNQIIRSATKFQNYKGELVFVLLVVLLLVDSRGSMVSEI